MTNVFDVETANVGLPLASPLCESAEGLDALTADGAVVRIRPVCSDDAPALADLHARSSDETLYRRFLSVGHNQIAGEVARLVRPADGDHIVLVAVESGRLVGVCSYEVLPGRTEAEFAVFVDDSCQGRGIGTLLMEHLAVWGRRHGVPDLLGEVLPSNSPMLRVASGLGQPMRSAFDLGLVELHLGTANGSNDSIDTRDLSAARHSLGAVLMPRCVAVIDSVWTPPSIGSGLIHAILDGGFTGLVYAVGPATSPGFPVDVYPVVAGAPTAPDLAIIAVAGSAAVSALAEAAAAGSRSAIVVSAGFGDDDPGGPALRAALVRQARSAGIRLVGPDSLGVINTDPTVRLHAVVDGSARTGALAIAAQSSAVGVDLLDRAAQSGIGVASFVALGDKADVSGNDLLSYWFDDPTAKAVALYLESVGNPRRFARIARAVGRRKPVLIVKSGRATALDATVDALFAQAGVIRCGGLGELIDTARMLVDQPLPAGNRIAIIGNSRGTTVLCADAAVGAGLTIPPLAPDVQATIRAAGRTSMSPPTNPIELGSSVNAAATIAIIQAVAPHVDAIIVAIAAGRTLDVIASAVDTVDKPVAVVVLGSTAPSTVGERRAPVYPLPEAAAVALGHAARYARWRTTPLGQRPAMPDIDAARARRLVADALEHGEGWQPPAVAAELLRCYGITVPESRVVVTVNGAVDAAMFLGFPVVLKTADDELTHKTDIGGVRLGIADPASVVAAYRDLVAATGDIRVMVQKQTPAGVELDIGVNHHPLFGSVLTCGLGGIATELLDDRARRLLPLTDRDATQMWRELRAAPMLTGYRGALPVNTDAVEDALQRIGRLAEDLPEVAELDVNPVIAGLAAVTAVDVRVRLAVPGVEPDAGLRALREPA